MHWWSPLRRRALVGGCVLACAVTLGCSGPDEDEEPSGSRGTESSAERLTVEMGHCFVEPVSFDGEEWNVPFKKQFGWGGMEPKNWSGTGEMVRVAEDEAHFKDDGGAVVVFRPTDDPSVSRVENALCA